MILIVEVEKKGEERSYKENVRLRKNKKLGRVSSIYKPNTQDAES
jgi:hypothetical protein